MTFFPQLFLNYNRYGEDFDIRYTDYDDFNNTRKDNETLQLGINYIPLKYETEKIKLEYVPKPNLENVMERFLTGKNKDPKPTYLLQDRPFQNGLNHILRFCLQSSALGGIQ